MTPIAAEGLPLAPSLRELIGETPDHLANLIWRLHHDAQLNAETAMAGLDLIARGFSTGQVRSALGAALTPPSVQGVSAPGRAPAAA